MMFLKRLIHKKLSPESWSRFNWEIDKEKPIEEACLMVFDTETTGLDLKRDEPIAIGGVKIESMRINLSNSFYTLLKPTKDYGDSIKVHGISPDELRSAANRKKACEQFIEYARNCIICGYFVHIDVFMVRKLVEKECSGRFYPLSLDLLDMLEPGEWVESLDGLLKRLELPTSLYHNALEDAYMTALALLKLIKEGGYRRVKDLPLKVV
ncbi:MAG: 3'-5' exonuclease [Acidobacteria bacterium]|jgi:DNA polymerase-3 subunit epsilon|nr:MAG: 3'-5' exonuclease [Acidobacteriota bacterium]